MAEKTSILVFYLSLSKTNQTFRWATIATLCVVNAAGLALTIVTIVQCNPVSAAYAWPQNTTAKCTDIITIYLSSAPANIITDLAILFLPMPILTSMRLPRKQKTILVVTFGFGIFVAVVDIVRIAYLQSAYTYRLNQIAHNYATTGRASDATDFSWYASFSFMWSAVEVNLGIMCACVPALKPLVSRFMPLMLRDEGDVTEKHSSIDQPGGTVQMSQRHRVPSMTVPAWLESGPSTEPTEQPTDMMDMMDILVSPGMLENNLQRSQTMLTNSTRNTIAGPPSNFLDFVNMKGKKSFVQMNTRESLFPVIMVTLLFFIWGFEYGLTDILNKQFQAVAKMSPTQTISIHSAYFAGYFLAPLTFGRLVLKHYGFKACYTIGLATYACGTLIFWPAAVLTSFTAFVISNLLVGVGLSTIEIAANPFIALCGPPEHAEIRLNLSQGFQAVGTVIAPLIARKALLDSTYTPSLINTQWAYLGMALSTVVIAIGYFYLPLPEVTDTELEERSERMDGANYASAFPVPNFLNLPRFRIIWLTLGFGVFSIWCYVGAQEVFATTVDIYLDEINLQYNTVDFVAIIHAIFAFSRFAAAGLCFFIKPRHLLLFYYTGAIVFTALAMNNQGATAASMIAVIFFFEGPIFSLVYAQSLRGLGRHTKNASALITAGISGGSVLSGISFAVGNLKNRTSQYSICVALAGFAGGILFPLLLNLYPRATQVVDPSTDPSAVRPEGETKADTSEGDRHDNSSRCSIASRALSLFSLRKKKSHDCIKTEWREMRGGSTDSSAQNSPH